LHWEGGGVTFWISPGGGGFPPKIVWGTSPHVVDFDLLWPEPLDFGLLGLKSIGCGDPVFFPLIVDIGDYPPPSHLDFYLDYLVCGDVCIPGYVVIFFYFPSGDGASPASFFAIVPVFSTPFTPDIDFPPLSTFSF
jgi:Uncharacterized protein predicted to be involved in C-type cytochrome biogenesis